MDNFIVSARKYRPQTFETVVGQQHITTTLKNAILQQQLAHAFLFCGPRGVGKTTCARILAKTINCEHLQPDGEACDQCSSCTSFNEGASLNIHELDAASNNSVEDIRSLVEQVRFVPQAGKYKVYIVDEVHMLSTSAFNAFLKTLEEPPHYAIFILATTEKHKILPTILSRCQLFDFRRITSKDTVDHLATIAKKEGIDAERPALQVIAQKSEGCMRDALSILDKIVSFSNGHLTYANTLEHLNILDDTYFFVLLEKLLQQDMANVLLLYDEVNSKGFEGDTLLNGFAEFIRNILVASDPATLSLLQILEGFENKYKQAAATTPVAFCLSALNILNEAEIHFKTARNKKLHTELALIKLCYLQQALSLSLEDNQIVQHKKLSQGSVIQHKYIAATPVKKPEKTARLVIAPEDQKPAWHGEASAKTTATPAPPQEIPTLNPTPQSLAKPPAVVGNNLLESLRNRYGNSYQIKEVKEAKALCLADLKQVWTEYGQKLEAEQKHTAANTFKTAQLNIINDNTYTVSVASITQQKLIEQERTFLNEKVFDNFHNHSIRFKILVEEINMPDAPLQQMLTSRERFDFLVQDYPLLNELKNRLNLDLEY
jgi:DNA polymerase-3 subunit gamma/tau